MTNGSFELVQNAALEKRGIQLKSGVGMYENLAALRYQNLIFAAGYSSSLPSVVERKSSYFSCVRLWMTPLPQLPSIQILNVNHQRQQ
ncbi:hypothetical protein [Phaeobacter gallaeciensis]|uniref:hypothetical protein n=1 Tax=Phaeobacter gallaeciensis TaxID=60890 RepID=UPI0011AB7460|nr:hypothetical protein [Phaeobacter gallaeciensis]